MRKKNFITKLLLVVILITNVIMVQAVEKNNDEMKAAWITTVYNQDWPSSSSKNNAQLQKEEFTTILDELQNLGLNTVVVQVRPKGDALYKSNINPWSDVLTGVQGKDPGYDPLTFAIEEAHKRGMKIHAWFNPYRITTSGIDINSLSENHFARQNPHTVITYKNALYYNPGLPEVRQHIIDTIAEVVENYNVDGIHFDDYFYPGNEVDDSDAYNNYGNGMDIGDFRRDNVNQMVQAVYNKIKSINRNVEFGISPRGIWKNKSSDSTGSDTNGAQSYYDIYADTRTWIKNNWLDYVAPQIYWEIGNKAADYSKLIPWWSNEVSGTNVDLYIGQGIYKEEVAKEIETQVNLNRTFSNIKGSIYFSYRDIKNNSQGIRETLTKLYKSQVEVKPEYPNWIPESSADGIIYQAQGEDYGWQSWVDNGKLAGTTGQYRRMESIRIKLNNMPEGLGIKYRVHVKGDSGWRNWVRDGEIAGTVGESKRLEAIQIELEGTNAENYIVEYRAHGEGYGWQSWVKDGQIAGSMGQARRIEGLEIRIKEKNYNDGGNTSGPGITYQGQGEVYGWQSWVSNGKLAGTTGESKRMEAIKIKLVDAPEGLNVIYRTHSEGDAGWRSWVENGATAGTVGEYKRLEAIQIKLEGTDADKYSIQYRAHGQDYGWQSWVKDGDIAGTMGQARRIEGIEIKLIKK